MEINSDLYGKKHIVNILVVSLCSLCTSKLAEKRKQENLDEGETDVNLQTAVEVEDAWEDEREAFTPASRTTGELKTSALPAPNWTTI